ncbi:MAG: copper amine oxidase [Selenomonas sp.]|uniref:copper amine oxidase n=1 Tax=Selenomonas sp. TaxID=2053611 RepID=UPI0025D93C9B|nr:copper amine oxidase [Selenomonas sp.]MCR5756695.1 copper amine oxidase [Selenomonas sp.]
MQVMKPWPVETEDSGGTLLFSDSPEYVKDYGILYRDVVQGDARVFYYHVNVTPRPGRLAVVLENEGEKATKVRISRGAMAVPSNNYFEVGKGLEIDYMRTPQAERQVHIDAGEGRLLHPAMAEETLQPHMLTSGMFDFYTAEPIRVSVVFCPLHENPISFSRQASVLAKDKEALRGTFPGMNRTVKAKRPYDPDKEGIVYVPIGDNQYDVYKRGIDATDGSEALNYGNYGVLYRFELPTKGKKSIRMLLTPLGGTYAGAVRVEAGKREVRQVHTPMGRLFYGGDTPPDLVADIGRNIVLTPDFELSNLGTYKSYKRFALEYSPPGASNMPVLLILSPVGQRRGVIARRNHRSVYRGRPLHRG